MIIATRYQCSRHLFICQVVGLNDGLAKQFDLDTMYLVVTARHCLSVKDYDQQLLGSEPMDMNHPDSTAITYVSLATKMIS